jgi:hypothetical protein
MEERKIKPTHHATPKWENSLLEGDVIDDCDLTALVLCLRDQSFGAVDYS